MRETWYVLEDGRSADPAECVCDHAGVLRAKDGCAVAMRGDAYSSRGVDPEAERTRAGATTPAKEMKPQKPKRTYETREAKVD